MHQESHLRIAVAAWRSSLAGYKPLAIGSVDQFATNAGLRTCEPADLNALSNLHVADDQEQKAKLQIKLLDRPAVGERRHLLLTSHPQYCLVGSNRW